MANVEFTDGMRSLMTNALTLAADRYRDNAKTFRETYEAAGFSIDVVRIGERKERV